MKTPVELVVDAMNDLELKIGDASRGGIDSGRKDESLKAAWAALRASVAALEVPAVKKGK